MTLDVQDIEAIAQRVAELLAGHGAPARLVDAAHVAQVLGVERDWVYAHADQLGAIRLGGPKGRLRFDLATVTAHADRTGDLAANAFRARPNARDERRPTTDRRPTTPPSYHLHSSRRPTTKVAGRRANAPGRDTGSHRPPMQKQRTNGWVS